MGIGPWPFRFRGGFVLPYRWFALGVGFGRYVWRRFRLILALVHLRCWFWRFRFRGGFVISYHWFALGVGFRRVRIPFLAQLIGKHGIRSYRFPGSS